MLLTSFTDLILQDIGRYLGIILSVIALITALVGLSRWMVRKIIENHETDDLLNTLIEGQHEAKKALDDHMVEELALTKKEHQEFIGYFQKLDNSIANLELQLNKVHMANTQDHLSIVKSVMMEYEHPVYITKVLEEEGRSEFVWGNQKLYNLYPSLEHDPNTDFFVQSISFKDRERVMDIAIKAGKAKESFTVEYDQISPLSGESLYRVLTHSAPFNTLNHHHFNIGTIKILQRY